MATTPRWGLRYPLGTDAPDVPLWMLNLATDLDDVAKDDQGSLSQRPAAGDMGRYFFVTGDPDPDENGILYRDNGASWVAINPAPTPAGASVARTTAQSIAASTDTVLTFPTLSYDVGGVAGLNGATYDHVNLNRAGVWLVTAYVAWSGSGSTGALRQIELGVTGFSGAEATTIAGDKRAALSSADATKQSITTTLRVTGTSGQIGLNVKQKETVSVNLTTAYLKAEWLRT